MINERQVSRGRLAALNGRDWVFASVERLIAAGAILAAHRVDRVP